MRSPLLYPPVVGNAHEQSLPACLTPGAIHMAEQLDALGGGNARIGRLELFVRVCPAPPGADLCMHELREGRDEKENVVKLREPRYPTSTPRTFSCTQAFPPGASQLGFCAQVGAPIIDWLWDGFNALLLGYGQTGTGKSHSLFGGSSYGPASEQDGLMHHILSTLLERSKKTESGSCTVGLQCWEVRGEKTVDLLRGDKASAIGTTDVTAVLIETPVDVTSVLSHCRRASVNWQDRKGDAGARPLPNRAHAFVRVTLTRGPESHVSTLTVVDPAGFPSVTSQAPPTSQTSESTFSDIDRKTARDNQRSLTALARLLSEVSQHCEDAARGKPQPSRLLTGPRTTLTNQLVPSLTANCKTFLLATISPSADSYLDSVNTLRVATRARAIVTPCLRAQGSPMAVLGLQSVQRVLSRATSRACTHAHPFSPLSAYGSDYSPCSSQGNRSPSEFVTPRVGKMTSRMRSKLSPARDASAGVSLTWAESENERSWAEKDWDRKSVPAAEERPGSVRRDGSIISVRKEGAEQGLTEEHDESNSDQLTSRSEQMASPKQVEDWEIIAKMARLDSLLSPDAGKVRNYEKHSPSGNVSPGRVTGEKERRAVGAFSRELESPQESTFAGTPPPGRFSREPSRSPRVGKSAAARARPRRASAVEAMESLNKEFEDVFSRIDKESPRKGGPVSGAGEALTGGFDGQNGGECERQGPEHVGGTVRTDREAAERDPFSVYRNGDGKNDRGSVSKSSVYEDGEAYVGRTLQLHRINSSIEKAPERDEGRTASAGATPKRNQLLKEELQFETGRRLAASLTPGTRESSRVGSPSRVVSSSGFERPKHGKKHRLERSYGEIGGPGDSPQPGGDSPGGTKSSGKKGRGALQKSKLSAGQTVRSSIDKLDRRRIEDLTSSVIASVAERKRREEIERETTREASLEVDLEKVGYNSRMERVEINSQKEKVAYDSPHVQAAGKALNEQGSPKSNTVSPERMDGRTEALKRVGNPEQGTGVTSPEVASSSRGQLDIPRAGGKKQSPGKAGESCGEAGDYDALLELLQRERQKRAETEGREAELERELLENSTSYSLKLDDLRLELHKARARCRLLERASSHAAVFEQYDQELRELRHQVRELRKEVRDASARYESDLAHTATLGTNCASGAVRGDLLMTSASGSSAEGNGASSGDSSARDAPFEVARDSQLMSASQQARSTVSTSCGGESRVLELMQREVKHLRQETARLEGELAAARRDSRHVAIQKRAAEDAICRSEALARRTKSLEEEVVSLQLRERAAIGGMQQAQRAAELCTAAEARAHQECAELGELLRALREDMYTLKRARRHEMAVDRVTGKNGRAGSPAKRKPRVRLPFETLARLQRSLDPHAKRAHEMVNELSRELGLVQKEIAEAGITNDSAPK
ncbi:hypothetical kinesin-like protein [Klebsormidium nitens]|uniref:Hypothetical kinesin-like protein n=1 Tax=Klebsormidium nitens TaxID=105231 RepID=A0A1Y1HRJ0_KLENI|nr:hypothetical kinesin-like protein [Klebsormidium nitens]|eukprot:GAQ79779.1 hypothetical kinesin-like protein [Klebsormidium nitens]